jgi:membrane fusion protein, adhesin transport system
MLNISKTSISERIKPQNSEAFGEIQKLRLVRKVNVVLIVLFVLLLSSLFLPWTQNVRGMGEVTTFLPSQRPQTLQSPIPGRIQKWFVREGDTVAAGDTIVFISELNNEFFDPQVVERTKEQLDALVQSITAYEGKLDALDDVLSAMIKNRDFKLQQTNQRISADSMDVLAAELQKNQSFIQFQRAETLFNEGIASRFEYEQRNQGYQEAQARFQTVQARYTNSKTDYFATISDFAEKISKLRSDRYTVVTQLLEAKQKRAQLENRLSNIQVRQGYYYLTAPQRGMITRTYVAGLGENIKEGEALAQLMPLDYQMAAEIFVRPVDLPLIKNGQKVRLEFDGWPAIVFSGWPNTSFGTFAAKVVAVDNVADTRGYRVLVVPDASDGRFWPEQLRFGSGVSGIMLLNDVPVWYELWRQINGFPPEYYTGTNISQAKK